MAYTLIPALSAVIIAALVDSVNPSAIGVLLLLISVMVVYKSKKELLAYGMIYIFFIFMTYLFAGLGILYLLRIIPVYLSEYISIMVGILIIIAGLVEIKDFFWYGKGMSITIPESQAKKIHDMLKKITFPTMIILGIFVAGVELPCTGGPYLAILALLSGNFNFNALMLLVIYNIIFVLPLIAMLFMVYFGIKVQILKRWKQNNRAYMRFATGIILVLMGWLLILIADGAISLN